MFWLTALLSPPQRGAQRLRSIDCVATSSSGSSATNEALDDMWLRAVLDPTEGDRFALACSLQGTREEEDQDRLELTYGEFDLDGFHEVLAMAVDGLPDLRSKCFCDFGSGAGRLVLAAAARYPWARCVGIEALPQLHEMAELLHAKVVDAAGADHALSPCEFQALEVSAATASEALQAVDVLFAFSTCFDDVTLADTLACGLRPGARVVTVDSMLPNSGDPAAANRPRFRLVQRAFVCDHSAYVWELSEGLPTFWIDYAVLT